MTAWEPNPGPQERFLAYSGYEALYGGAAGGGKSDALLIDPLRWIEHESFRAITFRRTYPELQRSLIERAFQYYPGLGGKYNDRDHYWRFPSGARLWFGHLEHEHDVHDYQSAEFQWMGFDELTSFTEGQYRYMRSRVRGSKGLPLCIRAGSNPGNEGADWVQAHWAPWLDSADDYRGPRAGPGEVLHYIDTDDGEKWVPKGTPKALSRVFIPAKAEDNPHLDPGYRDRLAGLDLVTRAQLRDGDWMIRASPGTMFRREWFDIVENVPANCKRVRYWDRAATEENEPGTGKPKNDPDWTVGLELARDLDTGILYVEDLVRLRGTPAQVEALVKSTARLDTRVVDIWLEEDPGAAGKFEIDYYVRQLAGWNVRSFRPTGPKIERAKPASAQAERGMIKLKRAPWNKAFLQVLEAFPTKGIHDDDVDALSGAVSVLVFPPMTDVPVTIPSPRRF